MNGVMSSQNIDILLLLPVITSIVGLLDDINEMSTGIRIFLSEVWFYDRNGIKRFDFGGSSGLRARNN